MSVGRSLQGFVWDLPLGRRVPPQHAKTARSGDPGSLTPPEQLNLPADRFIFVMGDNRDRSLDSRYWGSVPPGQHHGPPFGHLPFDTRHGGQ